MSGWSQNQEENKTHPLGYVALGSPHSADTVVIALSVLTLSRPHQNVLAEVSELIKMMDNLL